MIEKINLEWIKSFVFFAESGSVEEAASKLGLTQPAITQHLSKLDSALPQSLFEKRGKRKVLSDYGKDFYRGTSKELRLIDDILRVSKFAESDEKNVTLRLGVHDEIYYRICTHLEFDGQLEVYNQHSAASINALQKREIDIAVSRFIPDSSDVIAAKWFTDTFVLAYPASWQKEIDKSGLKETLLKKKFIQHMGGTEPVSEVLRILDLPSEKLILGHKLTNWLALIKLVQDGHGWSIVPSSFEFSAKIQISPLMAKGVPKTQYYILYHKSVRQFPGFQRLLASMMAAMK